MRSSLLALFILAASPLLVLAAPSAPVKALSGGHVVLSVRDLPVPVDGVLEKVKNLSGDALSDRIEGLSDDEIKDLVEKLQPDGKLDSLLDKIKDQDKLKNVKDKINRVVEKLGSN